MDPTTVLMQARSSFAEIGARAADLVQALPDLNVPMPGSEWNVRETAVHLVAYAGFCCDVATGMPSPLESFAREVEARDNAQRIADIPEADPEKVAGLITDGVERLLGVTAGRPGDQPVTYHGGFQIDLATLASFYLGEVVLHGYDMAAAVGVPWPIDPVHAHLVLQGYAPCFGQVVNQERARGLTAGFGIELRDGASLIVRFVDGELRLEAPNSGAVDCTISADSVAFLMFVAGRLSQWEAIALGLMSMGGDRPDLALGFRDLFIVP